ncbi:MAG: hypothetical protein N5P05_003544 [Chroococcopsis gigantea SAG 12.99]|jgi:subtilisin family serine protease/subtilase family serine protease|nr:hypothetical protein [Chroococcopsis gigantea SAG 12.99]
MFELKIDDSASLQSQYLYPQLPATSSTLEGLSAETNSALTTSFNSQSLEEISSLILEEKLTGDSLTNLAVTPDLVITNITTSSSSVASGAVFNFSYGIKNQGTATAANSITKFYLSRDGVLDSGDTLFNTTDAVSTITAGGIRQETASVNISNTVGAGNYYLIATGDGNRTVIESNEGNNVLSKLITVTRPDLTITSLNSPVSAIAGNPLNFNYTIRNQGNGKANLVTQTYFYLSGDSTLDSSDRLIGQDSVTSLNPYTSRTESASFTLANNISTGNYFLFAVADGTKIIGESNENNNKIAKSISVTGVAINGPDLVITNMASPSTVAAGDYLYFDYTIANRGTTAVDWTGNNTNFYLSTDNRLDAGDTYLATDYLYSLSPGATETDSVYISLDSSLAAGNYYLLAKADANNTVLESNETNNLVSKVITVTKPDLVVSNLASPASAVGGTTFYFDYTLTNQGTGGASYYGSSTKFYLSTNTTLDSNDTYFTSDYVSSLGAGQSATESIYVSLDDALNTGTYYILAQADAWDDVVESNENNNITSRPIAITASPKPDLTITNFTAPASVNAGSSLNISYTVRNQGVAGTGWYGNNSRFYLSMDGTVDSSDTVIGSDTTYDLDPNTSTTENVSIDIPIKLNGGTYYLLAQTDADGDIPESNENNNIASRTIRVIPSLDGYSATNGFGLVDASAAVAKALGQNPFPDVPDLGGNDWGADLVNAPEVWAKGYTGQGVIVAVLDTGVDRNHPDLAGNIWKNTREISGNGIDDDRNGYVDDVWGWNTVDNNNNTMDGHSHGTHVSGTIAGLKNGFGVTGIAYNAKIMPVKVLSDAGSGSDEGVAAGIRYAVNNGAKVINMSLGGDEFNQALKDAVQYASSKGVIVVMAAGNDGDSTTMGHYPAAHATNWGIAVGAVNNYNELADFSNRAGTQKLAYVTAPGVDVYSTVPNNGYDSYSGTSMATPHVAGVIALMLSAKAGLTDAQVRKLLTSTAENSPGPNGGINSVSTAQKVNAPTAFVNLAASLSPLAHQYTDVTNVTPSINPEVAVNTIVPTTLTTNHKETSSYDELTGLYLVQPLVTL